MPGERVPTAAIFSPKPIAISACVAFGATLTAAPISPSAGAASKTSAAIPKRESACAAANPASPPPTITMPAIVYITPRSGARAAKVAAIANRQTCVDCAVRASGTRLRLFELERAELSGDDEIVVVEHQSTRNAVLVKLEADGVSRCLLAGFRLLGLVEIADRNRPARDAGKLYVIGGGIVVLALVGPDLAADHGERIEHFLAGLGAVVDRKVENALAGSRRLDHPHHVLGRKNHLGIEIEILVLGLAEIDCGFVGGALGVAVDRIDQILVDEIPRGEFEALGVGAFPGG